MPLIFFYLILLTCVFSTPFAITFLVAFRKERKRSEYLLSKLVESKKMYIDYVMKYKSLINDYENRKND